MRATTGEDTGDDRRAEDARNSSALGPTAGPAVAVAGATGVEAAATAGPPASLSVPALGDGTMAPEMAVLGVVGDADGTPSLPANPASATC